MHKSRFDEHQLKKLLQNMPKVKDEQTPEQLFEKISSRIEDNLTEETVRYENSSRKPKKWILPSLASVVALVIIAFLFPSFFYQLETEDKNSANSPMKEMELRESPQTERKMTMFQDLVEESPKHTITTISNDEELIVVAIPDTNAQFVVPISFVVSKQQGKTKLDKLENIDNYLQETEWGLSNYLLEDVQFDEEVVSNTEKKLIIDVPANHSYGEGSATEISFINTVKLMAKYLGYTHIQFRTEGKLGITLGNYGKLTEMDLQNENTKDVYFLYESEEAEQTFLVPYPHKVSFKEAIERMQTGEELEFLQLQSPIPENIQIDHLKIDDNNHMATIEFAQGTTIKNEEKMVFMIEALLMTAKEYGATSVQFLNIPIKEIGPYQLSEPVLVPLAVNPMPYESK